ncbi:MAG: ABC transporter ATP-binding protein [Paracoccaceae bacterium]
MFDATDPLLDVENLVSGYGRSQVLFGTSLKAPRTGGIAVLGRNGAGKTTLLKTLIGELPTTDGAIRLDGAETQGTDTEHRVRAGMGYVPQEQAVFARLTVRENLALGGVARPGKTDFDMVLDFFPKLGKRLSQQAGTLSGGERKMLGIGRALLGEPRLLMLDEPTEGVWIGVIEEIAERLGQLTETMSIVIVEQHVDLALRVADYAYVMDRGRVALEGPAGQVKDDPDLLRYLAP